MSAQSAHLLVDFNNFASITKDAIPRSHVEVIWAKVASTSALYLWYFPWSYVISQLGSRLDQLICVTILR